MEGPPAGTATHDDEGGPHLPCERERQGEQVLFEAGAGEEMSFAVSPTGEMVAIVVTAASRYVYAIHRSLAARLYVRVRVCVCVCVRACVCTRR